MLVLLWLVWSGWCEAHHAAAAPSSPPRPHLIFIVADDLGWNDVGFHGSPQIPTPNIDALAYSGIILNRYYVSPICTPSRSALMTGRHPIHTGMQHGVLYGAEPRGLPLEYHLLPEYLGELGYSCHALGKWHLGSWKKDFLPTSRGFQSHFGFWTGHQDYNDHSAMETGMWGVDMRRDLEPATDLHGLYTTDLLTDAALDLIERHNRSRPLFLYLAHAAVHSGNPYNPLSAPDSLISSFLNITDYYRQRFAGMLTKLDISVGKVLDALEVAGMLKDSIVVFSTDNGGPAAGFNLNAASNWPLRGGSEDDRGVESAKLKIKKPVRKDPGVVSTLVKNTLWEGGVRGVGAIWSPHLKSTGRVSNQLFHIADWLPTLITAVGGNASSLGDIDGLDLWSALSEDSPSPRTEVLHNIDDIWGSSALTVGPWKLIKGTNYQREWDSWYGPSGREEKLPYNIWRVMHSDAGHSLGWYTRALNPDTIKRLRREAEVKCDFQIPYEDCNPLIKPCLFNIEEDPCEVNNLADKFPGKLEELLARLTAYNQTALPPSNLPVDPKGNPKYWNNLWTNFGDYESNAIS